MTDQEKRELLRGEVLAYLVCNHPVPFTQEQLQRNVADRLNASPDELRSALAFRVSLGHVFESVKATGATKLYAATHQGVLAYERGE
jgi:hypothetical protein